MIPPTAARHERRKMGVDETTARRHKLSEREARLSPQRQALLERRIGRGLAPPFRSPGGAGIGRVPRGQDLPLPVLLDVVLKKLWNKVTVSSNMSRCFRLKMKCDVAAME